jgi:hypothetical protein
MSSQQRQLHEFARIERLRALRNWSLGLGALAWVFSITAVGVVGVGNPKNASSIFSALAGEGFFGWAVVPLIAAGFALIVLGAALHALSRRKHGEI